MQNALADSFGRNFRGRRRQRRTTARPATQRCELMSHSCNRFKGRTILGPLDSFTYIHDTWGIRVREKWRARTKSRSVDRKAREEYYTLIRDARDGNELSRMPLMNMYLCNELLLHSFRVSIRADYLRCVSCESENQRIHGEITVHSKSSLLKSYARAS